MKEHNAKIRAAGILDSQPPEACEKLRRTVAALDAAIANAPAKGRSALVRARETLAGRKNFYRWGMGASGTPTNPLMVVQQEEFIPNSER